MPPSGRIDDRLLTPGKPIGMLPAAIVQVKLEGAEP